jgi:hypothetical protein
MPYGLIAIQDLCLVELVSQIEHLNFAVAWRGRRVQVYKEQSKAVVKRTIST